MKLLCLLLPHFPLSCEIQREVARRDRPVIILQSKDEASSQKTVLDFSPELGRLQPGVTLQSAISLYGEVELVQADLPYYWRIFNGILDLLGEKSPLIEGTELGCIYIGMDGLQLIYEDYESLVQEITKGFQFSKMEQSGKGIAFAPFSHSKPSSASKVSVSNAFEAGIGIAEGKFMSYLKALYCHNSATSQPGRRFQLSAPCLQHVLTKTTEAKHPGSRDNVGISTQLADSDAFLKDLPCDVLPVSIEIKAKLKAFGIQTLGQIRNLPPGPVQAQFGPEGRRMFDLARGLDDTPIYPRSMEETIEAAVTLSSVTVSVENIRGAFESLLSKIFKELNGRGIRSLTLWTRGWNGEYWERVLQYKEPATDVKTTTQRIKLTLENYPQPGPIEQAGLKITRLGYGSGRQSSLFSNIRARDHLMEDIKQLDLRLGKHQVFQVKEAEPWSRIPERRYTLTPLS
jgi:DNA polymerase IV